MPIHISKEVIGGVHVVRFNGNNSSHDRARNRTAEREGGLSRAPRWVREKAAASVRRQAKETEYKRRYLGGERQADSMVRPSVSGRFSGDRCDHREGDQYRFDGF